MSDVDDEEIGPTTSARCPECEHDRARCEKKQISAADESETSLTVPNPTRIFLM